MAATKSAVCRPIRTSWWRSRSIVPWETATFRDMRGRLDKDRCRRTSPRAGIEDHQPLTTSQNEKDSDVSRCPLRTLPTKIYCRAGSVLGEQLVPAAL